MNEGDWTDGGASVLGMQLDIGDDEVVVWFNRRAETVEAHLPAHEQGWSLVLVSDDAAEVPIDASSATITLPARSVVVLAPGG